MNTDDLFRAFESVDDDILERSEAPVLRRKAPVFRKWGVVAACMALIISLAGAAIVVEAKEYGAAVEFFEDNGLSMEGLSRSDVKAVYRDITTQRFTYDKTAEVLKRWVQGWEITQREPTPKELEALWNQNVWAKKPSESGISYRIAYEEKPDEALGVDVLDKSILECYQDGVLLWTAEFPDFMVEESVFTSGGTAVWGRNDTWSSEQQTYSWVARVDGQGETLWQRQLDHGFKNEYVSKVLDNGDGTWAVISRGDFEYLCLSQYDTDGNELSFCKNHVGNRGIWNAVRLGDGYLVQLGHKLHGENARLAKLDHTGNLVDNFVYQGEDCDYYLTDMVEFGNRVYLSAYAVPRQTDVGGRHEIANILDDVFAKDDLDISSEELTPMVRENYTAVLLLCEPEGGEPETFYSLKGSLGGALNVNDAGELIWDVESVVNTFFSPATNSFSIGGTCQVFRYIFDDTGALLRQEDTGETVPYRR